MDEVPIRGGAELKRWLQSLPVQIEQRLAREALKEGARAFASEVKAEIPVKDGDLRNSTKVVSGSKRNGRVWAHVKVGGGRGWYARFVHDGTKPHEIKPRGHLSLFIAGVFRKIVRHPGAKPNPFMKRAFDQRVGFAVHAVGGYLGTKLAGLVKK